MSDLYIHKVILLLININNPSNNEQKRGERTRKS